MNPCAIVNALYNLQIIIIITGYFSVNIRVVATFVAVAVVVVVTGRMPTGVYQVLFAMPVVFVFVVVVVAIAYTCLTSTQLAA